MSDADDQLDELITQVEMTMHSYQDVDADCHEAGIYFRECLFFAFQGTLGEKGGVSNEYHTWGFYDGEEGERQGRCEEAAAVVAQKTRDVCRFIRETPEGRDREAIEDFLMEYCWNCDW